MTKSLGPKGVVYWNKLDVMGRLQFILDHRSLFLSNHLVDMGEILAAQVTPESAREYILEREDSPFFNSIDISKTVMEQKSCKQFEVALKAAFAM